MFCVETNCEIQSVPVESHQMAIPQTLLRSSEEKERYLRVRFCQASRWLSLFMTRNRITGGTFTADGEFFLRTYDGMYLYYDFSDDKYTLGDGQGLDFTPAKR